MDSFSAFIRTASHEQHAVAETSTFMSDLLGGRHGVAAYARSETEACNRQFRRSLYVVRDVEAGAVLTGADVRSIRPGYGLDPARLPEVLGRTAARALKRGEPFAMDMIGG